MKLVVTGASGFIGGALVRGARALGHEVHPLARPSAAAGGSSHLQVLAARLAELKPDAVFHGAGTASVAESMRAPGSDFDAAVLSWRDLLEAVRVSGVRPHVLFPSSAAVYGNPIQLPVDEGQPCRPISPYGFHKLICETLANEYAACFGVAVTVVRLFSVFGPSQRRLLIWELYQQLSGSAESVVVQGTGRESRDFLDVDDVVSATLALAARRPEALRVLNVASGVETTVAQVAEYVRQAVAADKPIVYGTHARQGDPLRWVADITRLRQELPGWTPRSLTQALRSCVAQYDGPGP